MCNYTIYSFDCGHPAEDHVESKGCTEFERTGIHCDRENPANRGRIKVKSQNRTGTCGICRRIGRESDEIAAMQREMQRARELSLAEAKAQERKMRKAEQRAREESLAEAEARRLAHEARMKELERESVELYERQMREKEATEMAFMLQKSMEEEEERRRQEEERMHEAMVESLKLTASAQIHQDKQIPPAPPLPPPSDLKTGNKSPSHTSASLHKPTQHRPVDYSTSAIGPQNIGRFKLGTRSQPIHPSQEIQEPKDSASHLSPLRPSPSVRLGSQISPHLSPTRPARSPVVQVPPSTEPRGDIRRTAGPRSPLQSPVETHIDPQLQKLLAKRRTWESAEEEDSPSNFSPSPSQSASNIPSPASPSTASTRRDSRAAATLTGAAEGAWDEEDAKILRARRLEKLDFDTRRKNGWKGE